MIELTHNVNRGGPNEQLPDSHFLTICQGVGPFLVSQLIRLKTLG